MNSISQDAMFTTVFAIYEGKLHLVYVIINNKNFRFETVTNLNGPIDDIQLIQKKKKNLQNLNDRSLPPFHLEEILTHWKY